MAQRQHNITFLTCCDVLCQIDLKLQQDKIVLLAIFVIDEHS